MWIPEASLGNHTFMEPVMDVEKVPRNRWKLTCYICNQKMGACIQCGNKACYQAFHVTCARRARLFLKMKTSQGTLAVLDGAMALKAYCDRHCPPDYTRDNAVEEATRDAQLYYKRAMRGRVWADSEAAARALVASNHGAMPSTIPPWEATGGQSVSSMSSSSSSSSVVGGQQPPPSSANNGADKKAQPAKPIWRLPSGAPVIPHAVFELVELSLQRFNIRKRKDYVAECCRYWTLKRESRRGAALLKRLQMQMDTFTSMELTRRDFASMGPTGLSKLASRVEFGAQLVDDLGRLMELSDAVVQREQAKLDAVVLEQEFVDVCYFPVNRLLVPALHKAIA
jgi:NuA3 HAT complex component NTO1